MFKISRPTQFLLVLWLTQFLLVSPKIVTSQKNDRPIIGVLAQQRDGDASTSYIAAPYITHMAAAGARVVPILVRQNATYYRKMVASTNGLLLPGGHRSIRHSDYEKAAEHLFHFATASNDKGHYYPIYGVCLGFEMTTILILKQWAHDPSPYKLTPCAAKDLALNLTFVEDEKKSQIFHTAPPAIIQTLKSEGVTPNFHRQCLQPAHFKSSALQNHLKIVTTSMDANGLEFVSTMESINASRPIYLLQWHPEKIMAEFRIIEGEQESIVHTPGAISMVQYMANFVVGEARKNLNKFKTLDEENEALIFNCPPPVFTINDEFDDLNHFSQIYLFPTLNGCRGDEDDDNSIGYGVAAGVSNNNVKSFSKYKALILGGLAGVAAALVLIGAFVARCLMVAKRRKQQQASKLRKEEVESHDSLFGC